MSGTDWLEAAVRLLVVVSMGTAAVQGFRKARQQGGARTLTIVVLSVALFLYLAIGVVLVVGMGMSLPDRVLLVVVAAVAYFALGLFAIARLAAYLERRTL